MSDEICLYEAFVEDDDSIEDVLNKEYDRGYEKGRVDKEKELQGLKDLGKLYSEIRADAIEEYKERILEDLIPLEDKYFDLAKGATMPERYTHLKRMNTVDVIIEMVKIKAEQLKEQKEQIPRDNSYDGWCGY